MDAGQGGIGESREEEALRQINKQEREANRARNKAQKKKLNRHARKALKSKRSKIKR